MTPLARDFYERNTEVVAFELIGKVLIFREGANLLRGRIIETEAYFGANDPASHAHRGPTPRNQVMFGPPGFSYVYFTYGSCHCFNVVTESNGIPGAVLIRALEPIGEISQMTLRRMKTVQNGKAIRLEHLTNGPGKLTQAFGITRAHSGLDLTQEPLWISGESGHGEAKEIEMINIGVTKRIGISQAKTSLLRFYLVGSSFVSASSLKLKSVEIYVGPVNGVATS